MDHYEYPKCVNCGDNVYGAVPSSGLCHICDLLRATKPFREWFEARVRAKSGQFVSVLAYDVDDMIRLINDMEHWINNARAERMNGDAK